MSSARTDTPPEKNLAHSGHLLEIVSHRNTFVLNRSRLQSDRTNVVHGHQAAQPAPHIFAETPKVCFPDSDVYSVEHAKNCQTDLTWSLCLMEVTYRLGCSSDLF